MARGKWNRYKITSKKGLIFEMILEDWLKPGDYNFGNVEIIETLNDKQRDDYINMEENIIKLWGKLE